MLFKNKIFNYLNLYYQSLSVISVGGFIRDLHERYKVENPRRCAQWNLVSKGISLISGTSRLVKYFFDLARWDATWIYDASQEVF